LKLHKWRTRKARKSEVSTKETASLPEGLRHPLRVAARVAETEAGHVVLSAIRIDRETAVIEEARYEKEILIDA
jgi:predicted dinucleotide-binding enzyme